MPIYAYRCNACGHAKDVLQKISDPVLSTCPACGAEAFAKQVTAAGFQLKGSGWYVTDFRGGSSSGGKAAESGAAGSPAPAGDSSGGGTSSGGDTGASSSGGGTSSGGSSDSGGGTTAAAGGCGTSCACH